MSSDDLEPEVKPGRRKKQSEDFTKSFIDHVAEHFFDPGIISVEEIEKWMKANPVFVEMWKTRKITSLNVYAGKKKQHKESERKYKKQMYRFLTEMSELDTTDRVKSTLKSKAETSHFIQKYLNSNSGDSVARPDIEIDSISDRISDDARENEEITKLIHCHYNKRKYERLKHKLIERSGTETSLVPLVQLLDDPRSVVLFLFETKFCNLL